MKIARCCALVGMFWMLGVSLAEAQCVYSLTPTSFTVGSTAATRTLSITTGTSCSWTAVSTVDWISVSSGATGTGIGSVTLVVEANSAVASRTGTVTIAGQTVTVTQGAGSCTYTVTPSSFAVGSTASSRTLSVTSGTQCSWTASTVATWLTVTAGGSGSGIGSVTFSIAANPAASRTATLTVGGQSVVISQDGAGGTEPPLPPTNLRIVR